MRFRDQLAILLRTCIGPDPTEFRTGEICNNAVDDDEDGFINCLDADCYSETNCFSDTLEICDNGIDDDMDGLIDCFPNVWTGCLKIWSATRAGRMDEAWRLQEMGLALTSLFTSEGRMLYPATKAAMDMLALPGGGAPRPPLRALSGTPLEGLRSEVDRLLGPTARAA